MSEIEPPEPPEGKAPGVTPAAPEGEDAELSEFFHTDELPERGARVRRYRGSVDVAPYLARLLAPATAVVVVIVVILLMIWINGSSSGPVHPAALRRPSLATSRAAAPTSRATSRASSPATSAATAHPSSHATSAAHRATRRATHHRVAPASPPPTHLGRPASHARTAAVGAMAPVTVLNNSRRTGLAHAAASRIHAKGWKIGTVGNLQGALAVSTVFYAPGDAAAARHLAHDFGSIKRIEPNHAGHMHGSALTLVVTANWRL